MCRISTIEAIGLFIALGLFLRGVSFLLIPKSSRRLCLDYLRKPKTHFNKIGWVSMVIGLMLVGYIAVRVSMLDIIIVLIGSMLFVGGWSLLFAQRQIKELWRVFINKSSSHIMLMGVLHIAAAGVILWLVLN